MTQLDEQVKTCAVDGCTKVPRSFGLCVTHYMRKRRGAPMLAPIREYKTYDDPEGFRTCSECETTKTIDEFYDAPGGGKRRKCKVCLIQMQ